MTGEDLRALRLDWGLSQRALGRMLGYTAETIAHLENGRKSMTESMQKHLAALITIRRIEKIITGEKRPID